MRKGVGTGALLIFIIAASGALLLGSSIGMFAPVLTDLQITSMSANPSTVTQGHATSVAVTVTNDALVGLTTPLDKPVTLKLTDLTVAQTIGTQTFTELGPGQSKTFTFNYNNVNGLGNHDLEAFVDSENVVIELKEDNNRGAVTINVVQNTPPVTDISHSPANPTTADSVTFTATASDSDGTITALKIFVDNTLKKSCGSSPCAYVQTFNSTGNHTYRSEATDNNGAITSSATKTLTVTQGQQTQPDLTLISSDISFSPQNPNQGQNTTVSATVHNIGGGNAGSYVIKFEDITTGQTMGTKTVPGLNAGASGTASITWAFNSTGNHTVRVTADSNNQVTESNENNNKADKVIVVG